MNDGPHRAGSGSVDRREGGSIGLRAATTRRLTSTAWLARAAGFGLSASSVGFVVALGVALSSGGRIALFTRPLPLRIALAVPYLVLAFAAGTTLGTVLAWWRGYWSIGGRIHQTVLTILGLALVWKLFELGLLFA